jgi:hypothetical protein
MRPLSSLAHADGEHRHVLRLEAGNRFIDRPLGIVRAIAHDDQARDRQAAQFIARAVDRIADPGGRTLILHVVGGLQPLGGRGKAENLEIESLAQRRQERCVRPSQFGRNKAAARLAFMIGHLHAAGIVQDDANEVLLRDRNLEQQHRPQQAEQHDHEQADADREQRDAIARRQCSNLPVRP